VKIDDLPTNEAWSADDWAQVFPATEERYTSGDYSGTFEVGPGGKRLEDVTAERIAEVLHWYAIDTDGPEFFAVVRLTDGQHAVSEAWADNTGWGCHADAWWKVGPTYESVMAELSEVNRQKIAQARRLLGGERP
jgi:hypothetical protein